MCWIIDLHPPPLSTHQVNPRYSCLFKCTEHWGCVCMDHTLSVRHAKSHRMMQWCCQGTSHVLVWRTPKHWGVSLGNVKLNKELFFSVDHGCMEGIRCIIWCVCAEITGIIFKKGTLLQDKTSYGNFFWFLHRQPKDGDVKICDHVFIFSQSSSFYWQSVHASKIIKVVFNYLWQSSCWTAHVTVSNVDLAQIIGLGWGLLWGVLRTIKTCEDDNKMQFIIIFPKNLTSFLWISPDV